MSLPKSPYTKPSLPEVPGELDDESVIQPNLFNKNRHPYTHQKPSSTANIKIFDDFNDRIDQRRPTDASFQQMAMPGEIDAKANEGQTGTFMASQLTFNNEEYQRKESLPSGTGQIQGMVDGVLGTGLRVCPKDALSTEMNPFVGSGINSQQSSFPHLPDYSCDEDRESRRHIRRVRANENRRSRSRSNHPGKPFPTFEPPVYLIDQEVIVDDERANSRNQSVRSHRDIIGRAAHTPVNHYTPVERRSNTHSEMTVETVPNAKPIYLSPTHQTSSLRQVVSPSLFSKPPTVVYSPRHTHQGGQGSPKSIQGQTSPVKIVMAQGAGQSFSHHNSSDKLYPDAQLVSPPRYSYATGKNIRILEKDQPRSSLRLPETNGQRNIEPLFNSPSVAQKQASLSPIQSQSKGLLVPPPQSIEDNRLRESTMVTEDLIKDRDQTSARTTVHPPVIFNSALEMNSSLTYTTYQPLPQSRAGDNSNPARELRFDANNGGSVGYVVHSTNQSSRDIPNTQNRLRFASPQHTYLGTNTRPEVLGVVQSERRLDMGTHHANFMSPESTHPKIPNHFTYMQRKSSSRDGLPHLDESNNTGMTKNREFYNVGLKIVALPCFSISPRSDGSSNMRLNELILENSRLRGELGVQNEKLKSATAQLTRLSNVETDFYLLLNHVTQAETASQFKNKRDAEVTNGALISPVLLELLDVNSLLEKEKKKLDECVREREMIEGIIKGLKMRLRDQVGRYSANGSEAQPSKRSQGEENIDTQRQEMTSERDLSKQMVNNPGYPTIQVDSEIGKGTKNSEKKYYGDFKASLSERGYQAMDRGAAPLVYGSMMSDEPSEQRSGTRYDYSTSQINGSKKRSRPSEPSHLGITKEQSQEDGSPKNHINIYSADNNGYEDQGVTPKLGGGSPSSQQFKFEVKENSNHNSSRGRQPAALNMFESQDDTPRQEIVSRSVSGKEGPSQNSNDKQGSENQGRGLVASINPLAMSRSVDSNNYLPNWNNPETHNEGPFQITMEKTPSRQMEESSWSGGKKIVSRFGTIIPNKEKDDEMSKLKEAIERLARENQLLQLQVAAAGQNNTESNSVKADKPRPISDIERKSIPEVDESAVSNHQAQTITIKLPKSDSFGDYSSSGGGIYRKSAAFCEVNFDGTDESKKKSNCSGDSRLSPGYKNIDFFGDRPSLIQPKKADFINIHEEKEKSPKSRVTELLPEKKPGKNEVSIYSFQPSNEMLSMLNNGNPYDMNVDQMFSMFQGSALQNIPMADHQKIDNRAKPETPVKDLLVSEMRHEESPTTADPELEKQDSRQITMAKVADLYSKLKATKAGKKKLDPHKRGRANQVDEADDELPTRHAAGQEEELSARTPQNQGKQADLQIEVNDLKKIVEEMANRIQVEGETDRTKAKIEEELNYLKTRIVELTNIEKNSAQGEESFHSDNTPLDDKLTMEDMKARYIKLMQAKASTSRQLKEEQSKSRKYREMVVAKLKAIDTMKDVYQRQIQRMVDSEDHDDDEDETYS